VFGLVHCSQIFDRKNTNSNRRTFKKGCSRLNFNYFKERFVHFNGTVMLRVLNNLAKPQPLKTSLHG
ncbi:MAG: hypothetical protein IJK93_04950, partial [Muribaculaceae bacterium]|nr:hypothetical protein [Muribaculaceae bacterium]